MKAKKYQEILPQIKGLLQHETDEIANMANVSAVIKESFGYFWVGFYVVKNEELVLAPFQGPVACTRIKKGKGVCGKAWDQNKAIIVPNVNEFSGHIACNPLSQSEIVVPWIKNGEIKGVLDVDSQYLNTFDEVDKKYLTQILTFL